jgi:hypothetical protein
MPTPRECRRNAETCLKLARETNEIYARAALAELAIEFRKRANQLDKQSRRPPASPARQWPRLRRQA